MTDITPNNDNLAALRSLPTASAPTMAAQRMLAGESSVVSGGSGAYTGSTMAAISLGDFTIEDPGEHVQLGFPTSFSFFNLLSNFFREVRITDLAVTPEAVGDLTATGFRVRTCWSTSQVGPITTTGIELEDFMCSISDNTSWHFNQFNANTKPHYCSYTNTPYQVSPTSLLQGEPVLIAAFFNAAAAGTPRVRFRISATLHMSGFRILSTDVSSIVAQGLLSMQPSHRDALTKKIFKLASPAVVNALYTSTREIDDNEDTTPAPTGVAGSSSPPPRSMSARLRSKGVSDS